MFIIRGWRDKDSYIYAALRTGEVDRGFLSCCGLENTSTVPRSSIASGGFQLQLFMYFHTGVA